MSKTVNLFLLTSIIFCLLLPAPVPADEDFPDDTCIPELTLSKAATVTIDGRGYRTQRSPTCCRLTPDGLYSSKIDIPPAANARYVVFGSRAILCKGNRAVRDQKKWSGPHIQGTFGLVGMS
jgi:hypothetical protein